MVTIPFLSSSNCQKLSAVGQAIVNMWQKLSSQTFISSQDNPSNPSYSHWENACKVNAVNDLSSIVHSLIRVVLIQSCSAGAENFTNYVFCHPQFSGVIQNIKNCCAIRAKF